MSQNFKNIYLLGCARHVESSVSYGMQGLLVVAFKPLVAAHGI